MKISQVTFVLLLTVAIASRVDAAIASWDPNTEPDIAGYLLSYGTAPGEHLSTIDVGNVTTVQFNPEPGRRYYVVVRAYNSSGYLSEKSSEATIDIPGPNSPPPSPPPPPPMATTSPNNALVPPLAQIVDATGGIWTLGPSGETLRNGVHQHGGVGTQLLWYNAGVYTYGLDGSWYRFDNGWIRLNTTVQPGTVTPSPAPPPPPPTPTTSPNNALVPPLTQIVDATGGVWTLGPNGETLLNGVHQHGGRGTRLLWYNAVVYTYGLDDSWYGFDNGWIRLNTTVQPGTVTSSPPPPPPPPTGAPTTSPNNALVPPLTEIVDATGGVWTLGPNGETLLNGVHQHGGFGTQLLWYDAVIYTYGLDDSWYRFDNGWIRLN